MLGLLTGNYGLTTDVAHTVDGQNFAAMGWLRHALPPAPEAEVSFTLNLKQRNLDQLKARALSVNSERPQAIQIRSPRVSRPRDLG